ncbi:hypothetical protein NE236_21425 [Actinoallomurus purpureus]|jgi:hypothetical protein|uniref:hypothetical protein n=1 Tax=Actinoallomurus purpureus TaxID=478114 RepID=UPI0020926D20|nr:hypothetical protein [Actinoallomurus purpureus]MCO6007544.1 hypothetical protein [Actinoallomurus purpureus]
MNELQRAIDDFYATLDALRFQGVSQVAEVQQLEILIRKYPESTQRLLERLGRHHRGSE